MGFKNLQWLLLTKHEHWKKLTEQDAVVFPIADQISEYEYEKILKEEGLQAWVLIDLEENWIANFQLIPNTSHVPQLQPRTSTPAMYLNSIAVFPPHQSKGYSHILMKKLLALEGHKDIYARTRDDNTRSQKLLSKYHFKEVSCEVIRKESWVWFLREAFRI